MAIDIGKLAAKPRPSLVVYDSTYEAQNEVARLIKSGLEKFVFASTDDTVRRKQKLAVALQSIVFLIAEDVSQATSKLEGMVHLRKEDFEQALGALTLVTEDPVALVNLATDWATSVSRYLSAELKTNSNREAIFRTCEQFKIDLLDFEKIFSPDELNQIKDTALPR